MRTHYASDVSQELVEETISVSGWVDSHRHHGGVIFIDLRDNSGIVQVVFEPGDNAAGEVSEIGHSLRNETSLSVTGIVRMRPEGMINKKIASGHVELVAISVEVFNRAETLPIDLNRKTNQHSDMTQNEYKYRYLDLRRPELFSQLKLRSDLSQSCRTFLNKNRFFEVETPILYKSTPEGARDFLVPSRLQEQHFFALPQSPQILKQLCMIGGIDRYYQFARCFRDEDLRADRQPEFTQLDIECSFLSQDELLSLQEEMIKNAFNEIKGVSLPQSFQRISYRQAILEYGSDKPDLRNPLKLIDVTEFGKRTSFKVYQDLLEDSTNRMLCLNFAEDEKLSRKQLDDLNSMVAPFGLKGVSWIRIKEDGEWQSPQAKFFDEDLREDVVSQLPHKKNSLMLMACGPVKKIAPALGFLRQHFGQKYLQNPHQFEVAWVVDFPLFEYSLEDERFYSMNHPFTAPSGAEPVQLLEMNEKEDLLALNSVSHDLVINGQEVGGGSQRIHCPKLQRKVFEWLGLSSDQINDQFGFFIEALSYGAPPHGGIAYGVDRLAAVMLGSDSIRDVIAFPKTQKGSCLMSGAPSVVDSQQLKELSIKTI